MEWKRISREDFQAIPEEEIASLSPEVAEAFKLFRVPLGEQSCFRDDNYGMEKVLVVARNGDRLLSTTTLRKSLESKRQRAMAY